MTSTADDEVNASTANIQRTGRSTSMRNTRSSTRHADYFRQTATSEEDLKKAMKFASMGLMSRQSCAFYEQYANNNASNGSGSLIIPRPLINEEDIEEEDSDVENCSSDNNDQDGAAEHGHDNAGRRGSTSSILRMAGFATAASSATAEAMEKKNRVQKERKSSVTGMEVNISIMNTPLERGASYNSSSALITRLSNSSSSSGNANKRHSASSEAEGLVQAMKFARMGLMSRQSCAFYEQYASTNSSSIPKPLYNEEEDDCESSSLGSFSCKNEGDIQNNDQEDLRRRGEDTNCNTASSIPAAEEGGSSPTQVNEFQDTSKARPRRRLLYDKEQQQMLDKLKLSYEGGDNIEESRQVLPLTTPNTLNSGEGTHRPQQPSTISSPTIQVHKDNTSTATTQQEVDILTEGQHYLSISMLVYMYSHLRETCRMGHTRSTFEEIDVNSFQSLYGRRSPEEEALLEDEVQQQSAQQQHLQQTNKDTTTMSRRNRRTTCKRRLSSFGPTNIVRYLDKTKSSGGIIRIVIDELGEEETGNHDDVGNYSENDQRQEFICGNPANREYEKSMMKEFRGWFQDSKESVAQLDARTEEVIVNLRRQVARQRWKRAISLVRISRHLGRKLSNTSVTSNNAVECEDIEKMSPNEAQMTYHIRRRVARYRWKRAIIRVIIGIRLRKPGIQPQWNKDGSAKTSPNCFVDMKRLMSEAMQKQPRFFRDGSVMNNLIESGIEVVWFSDLSQNDVVYGICCQREEKRITVVFRGTVNSHNWVMNTKLSTTEVPNPITEKYPGRTDMLDLHTGFSLYMLRRRKDTQMNKTEEILQKIDAIGREMCPDGNYTLSITGHSMGGALATLLGFYVATSTRFENVKQIRIFTFAAPRVGTNTFRNAYQYLERLGKVRHARFSCAQDFVPLVPFCNLDGYNPFNWKFYKHVGLRVQLHGVNRVAKWRLRNALDVTYPLCHDFLSEMKRMLVNSLFVNLNTLAGYKRNHTLTEHQRSIQFASQYRLALGKSIFFSDYRRNRIKSLEEYYSIRANISTATDDISEVSDNSVEASPRSLQKDLRNLMVLLIVVVLMICWSYLVIAVTKSLSSGKADVKGPAFVSTTMNVSGIDMVPEVDYPATLIEYAAGDLNHDNDSKKQQFDQWSQLDAIESGLKPLKEYYTSVEFAPKLDKGLYLVGAGVRKKSIIKVYSVAMYSSPTVLINVVSPKTLQTVACAFDSSTPVTSFLLEIVYGLSAEKIAGAIAESVRPRYGGSSSDINALESLIIAGVNDISGQAVKGTMFRFDCSADGVAVTVNGAMQGTASFKDLGRAFVDVFLDENAVSPTLVDSCVDAWSTKEAQIMASNLLGSSQIEAAVNETSPVAESHEQEVHDKNAQLETIESTLKPMKEYFTSLEFAPKLGKGLYLVGAGVRKKSIIKVYSVAMYSSPTALVNAMTSKALGTAARTFDSMTPTTTFVLKMVYSVGAEKIASAIAESVRPRYSGPLSDINALESLIIVGVNGIGGQAVPGTVFRFDCSAGGVGVTVDNASQGVASFTGLGSAFVDVFMGENAVSPTLIDSCLSSWSGVEAKSLATSLLEMSQAETNEISDTLKTADETSLDKVSRELDIDEIALHEGEAASVAGKDNGVIRQSETTTHQNDLDLYWESNSINHIGARDEVLNAVQQQSIQNSASIQSQASDRAAMSLYRLESFISEEDDLSADNSGKKQPFKKLIQVLF